MSRYNRPGKREREARNRHKRGLVSFQILIPSGPKWITVKLGRRKSKQSFSKLTPNGLWHLEEKLKQIPVADVRELRRERSL